MIFLKMFLCTILFVHKALCAGISDKEKYGTDLISLKKAQANKALTGGADPAPRTDKPFELSSKQTNPSDNNKPLSLPQNTTTTSQTAAQTQNKTPKKAGPPPPRPLLTPAQAEAAKAAREAAITPAAKPEATAKASTLAQTDPAKRATDEKMAQEAAKRKAEVQKYLGANADAKGGYNPTNKTGVASNKTLQKKWKAQEKSNKKTAKRLKRKQKKAKKIEAKALQEKTPKKTGSMLQKIKDLKAAQEMKKKEKNFKLSEPSSVERKGKADLGKLTEVKPSMAPKRPAPAKPGIMQNIRNKLPARPGKK
jgi:hypothetical protein